MEDGIELQEQQMTVETEAAPRTQQEILKDIEDQVMSCIHCGLCLAFCHSFEALGSEASSPRGRVHLIRAVAEGRMEMSDRALMHFCLCTLCNRCQLGCPVGMDLADLVRNVRGELAERLPEGLRATVAALFSNGRTPGNRSTNGWRLERWKFYRKTSVYHTPFPIPSTRRRRSVSPFPKRAR